MVYMAMSSTQADLYVPSKLLEEAKMLISAEMGGTEDSEPDEEFLEYIEQCKKPYLICIYFAANYGNVLYFARSFSCASMVVLLIM